MQVVLLSRDQLIKAAGLAGISDQPIVMISQEVPNRDNPRTPDCFVEHISGDNRVRHSITPLGVVEKLGEEHKDKWQEEDDGPN